MNIPESSVALNSFRAKARDRTVPNGDRQPLVAAMYFFGGEFLPDCEIASRRIITILLSAGITEQQILDANMNVTADAARAIYFMSRGEPTDATIPDDWTVDLTEVLDVRDLQSLVLPVVPDNAMRKELVIECLDHIKMCLLLIAGLSVDIVKDQPDLRDVDDYWAVVESHQNKFRGQFGDYERGISYRLKRLAQLGYDVPDEWVTLHLTNGTHYDGVRKEITISDWRVDYYQRLASELKIRIWRLENEPDNPKSYAPKLKSDTFITPEHASSQSVPLNSSPQTTSFAAPFSVPLLKGRIVRHSNGLPSVTETGNPLNATPAKSDDEEEVAATKWLNVHMLLQQDAKREKRMLSPDRKVYQAERESFVQEYNRAFCRHIGFRRLDGKKLGEILRDRRKSRRRQIE